MLSKSINTFTKVISNKSASAHIRFFSNYTVSKLKDNNPDDKRQVYVIESKNNQSGLDKLDEALKSYSIFTHRDKEKDSLYVVQDEKTSFGNLLSCFANNRGS